jgi:alcohol dehydrogenase class IV
MNFQFGIPSFVTFGEGCTDGIGEMVQGLGGKRVFCVYDKGVKSAGIVDGIVDKMKSAGIEVIEYDKVLPNPPDTLVEEAAELARKADIDVMVAIGGGSAMDCAKAINILLTNPSPINQYNGINLVKFPTKPLIAVPTTSGTGSEVTAFSIITDTTNIKKMVIGGQFVGATFALADPLLTVGLPSKITASTGMDALTHAIEAYVSKGAMIPTDVYSLKAIDLIFNSLAEATLNGSNIQARTDMLLGSMLAGFAFNSAVLGLVHSIAHPLSAHCGLPHGVANAVGLPHVMAFNAEVVPERTKDIALAMNLDVVGLSPVDASKVAVEKIKALSKEISIPSLKELGIDKDIFPTIAKDAIAEISTMFNPRSATEEDVMAILELAYENVEETVKV